MLVESWKVYLTPASIVDLAYLEMSLKRVDLLFWDTWQTTTFAAAGHPFLEDADCKVT